MEKIKTYKEYTMLNEGKISDFLSQFNLSEIKKSLKEKFGLDSNSSKEEIKKVISDKGKAEDREDYDILYGMVIGNFIFNAVTLFQNTSPAEISLWVCVLLWTLLNDKVIDKV